MSTGSPDDPRTIVVSNSVIEPAEVRFTPGTLIGGRYRIVSLLGKGGMGEVYRADDLRVGQRVALKYVPEDIAADPATLMALISEVRLGRQISHPNVCRLYDLAEANGQHFISMEYIDGEDLASLLRRIGRLAPDKALALSRDLCAGLAAAHGRGIIHRDLKPANVMIDGSGTAHITDFGVAVLHSERADVHEIAGTPAYMSPEQLQGETATMRSDVYALGLILYEMFTGRRVFDAASIAELRTRHSEVKRRPSSIVHGIDPAIERVILRCLEEEPGVRPAAAHEVMALLPGSDPLQAAIDAGETPSPALLAAAGEQGDISAARGWLLFGGVVATLIATAYATQVSSLPPMVPNIKSRDALIDRAREVTHAFGLPAARGEHGQFRTNVPYVSTIVAHGPREWRRFADPDPSPLRFIYRSSPAR